MEINYAVIAAQVIGLAAMIVTVLSLQCRSNQNFFRCQSAGGLLFTISFMMLGAWSGAMMNLYGILRPELLRREKIATMEGCKYLTRHHPGNEFNDPLGKFSPHFFPNILRHHGYDPAYTMMIGDEPKRDLYPALEAGIRYCVIIDRSQTEDIVEKEGGIFIRSYHVLIDKIKN